jgi:hypothetical protein
MHTVLVVSFGDAITTGILILHQHLNILLQTTLLAGSFRLEPTLKLTDMFYKHSAGSYIR